MRTSSSLPEDFVCEVISKAKDINSYYAEAKITTYKDTEAWEENILKEWVSLVNGKRKRRAEISSEQNGTTILINDGNRFIEYHEKEKQALVSDVLAKYDAIFGRTPKARAIKTLEGLYETHDIENLGQEEISGIKTHHIKAVPKKDDSPIDIKEYWIDKETCLLAKTVTHSGNTRYEEEYTTIDYLTKIDDGLFMQQLPEDVKVRDLDEGLEEEEVTLEEVSRYMENPILCAPEASGYKLKQVKRLVGGVEGLEDMIAQEYVKHGKISFYIYIRKLYSDKGHKLPREEDITVRGKKGSYIDGSIKMIRFSENGLGYSFSIKDDDIKIEDGIKIIESMTPFIC